MAKGIVLLVQLLYIVALLASLAGGFTLLSAFSVADSVDRAALAALACAMALIPYVFARAVQIVVDRKAADERHKAVLLTLELMSDRVKELGRPR